MTMSKLSMWGVSCLCALLLLGVCTAAQDKDKSNKKKNKVKQKSDEELIIGKSSSSGDPVEGALSDGTFKFLAYRYAFDKEVKGAPYSATAVTETVNVLSDGNTITRKQETKIYRDGQGRTRRDQVLGSVGKWAAAGEPPQMTVINDPVGGFNYILNPRNHTARKLTVPKNNKNNLLHDDGRRVKVIKGGPNPQELRSALLNMSLDENLLEAAVKIVQPDYAAVVKATRVEGEVRFQLIIDEAGEVESITFLDGPAQLREPALAAARECRFNSLLREGKRVRNQGTLTFKFTSGGINAAPSKTGGSILKIKNGVISTAGMGESKTESLGRKTIDTLEVEGTRSINVIPAGEVGNRQPIEVISERWYSPELQILVMSKYTDPRQGTTIYRLAGITRSEPDPSLFQIPLGYAIQDESLPKGGVK